MTRLNEYEMIEKPRCVLLDKKARRIIGSVGTMSDCSTQAMLPKEQPSDEQIDKYVLHFVINDPDEYIHQVSEVEVNDCKFINAQRCQQLEQVAQDMLKAIAPMHEPCCEDTCRNLADMGWQDGCCYLGFREQLEALGVGVDV